MENQKGQPLRSPIETRSLVSGRIYRTNSYIYVLCVMILDVEQN